MSVSIDMYACARVKIRCNTHSLGPYMNVPFEQNDVSIQVVIVILETSYRRARRDIFDGTNDGLVKLIWGTRGREMRGRGWISLKNDM